jgi:membrane protease YdiL (CAAX protease family)
MRRTTNPLIVIGVVYVICYAIRMVELLVIRTDQGFFGEAFIQKATGIVILVLAVRCVGYSLKDIGFVRTKALTNTLLGLGLGVTVFVLAYASEYILLTSQGQEPSLAFYVTAYSVNGNIVGTTTLVTLGLCLGFNVINVVMEEGIFRGLFTKLAEKRLPFIAANIVASLLFGLWHIALPIRNYLDGEASAMGAFFSGLMYVVTSFLMGFQMGLLARMTGGLWASMGFHFVNNTVVNLLHVTSTSGADNLLTMRLTITGTCSFVIVLVIYIRWYNKQKALASTSAVRA